MPAASAGDPPIDSHNTTMKKSTVVLLLALVVTLFVNALFIVALAQYRFDDPLLAIFYACCLPFYLFLYRWRRLRRTRHQDELLRSGLGYAAVGFGMFLSIVFVYGFARHIPLHWAVAAWLFSAVPLAFCYYRVIVLHLELQEEEAMRLQAPAQQASFDRPPI